MSGRKRSKYANLRKQSGTSGAGGRKAGRAAVPSTADFTLESAACTKLPIFAFREELEASCFENDTTVVVGETGSGKSTQLPKYLLSELDRLDNVSGSTSLCNVIACTQPRRVAAVTVARRVAREMGCAVGRWYLP